MFKINKKKNRKGFTLIELLIVVAIIAILAAIAIPQFSAYRARAVRASMVADSKNVATAMETMFQDCSTYSPATNFSKLGPGSANLIVTQTNCTGNTGIAPVNVNISRGNTLKLTSVSASSWTMTVTNTGGDETGTWEGPITRDNAGNCNWTKGGPC